MTISIDQVSNEILKAFGDYNEKVTKGITRELNKRSNELTEAIRNDSPKSEDGGYYKAGWTKKRKSEDGRVSITIYNKNRGSIAHLLEHGHVKRGGGRVAGKLHVGPNTERETAILENNIKSIIKRGG